MKNFKKKIINFGENYKITAQQYLEICKNSKPKRFTFLSPDGFPINEPFISEEEGWEFFEEWKTRYETQGYYSYNGGKIFLHDLKNHIKIEEIYNE